MARRRWLDSELNLLRSMYPECHTADVAEWIGRTVGQCYQAAAAHGLKKSAEYLASDCAARIKRGHQNEAMKASRFQLGLTPWNKGRDSRETGTGHHPNTRRTQFAKGRMAHEARNYVPIGSLRVSKDGYLERKLTDDPSIYPARRWVAVHRIVWEQANGPIPAGHIVVFRLRMKTTVPDEVTADRLECITRAENARRNHPRSRSPELGRLVQLKGAIARQVNRIAREAQEHTA